MRIYSMTATFGKLEHQTLTLKPGLNVISAPNEWGKSTWCAFLVAMLYGIDTRERNTQNSLADKEHYKPWSGSPMSGRMDIHWRGRDITLERSTKGRAIMGEFSAYETATGLPVPELTATNCGEMLLGVEKSVFVRAGFIRMADMPITNDESLRRRLNALVTTGDESGASDDLAQKLKELKNSCRHNRTGALPQAEGQRAQISDKLQQLEQLQQQCESIRQRQEQLQQQIKDLENHKASLAYAASEKDRQKLQEAKQARDKARVDLDDVTERCKTLPNETAARQTLQNLRDLQQQWNVLQEEPSPVAPEAVAVPAPFTGLDADQALLMAKTDYDKVRLLQQPVSPLFWILAIVSLLAGAGMVFVSLYIMPVFLVLAVVFVLLQFQSKKKRQDALTAVCNRYGNLTPEFWIPVAEKYKNDTESYAQSHALYKQQADRLHSRREDLTQKTTALTQGQPLAAAISSWESILVLHGTLHEAQTRWQQASEYAATLESVIKPVDPPAYPDMLVLSEIQTQTEWTNATAERGQLERRLGQCQGQMNTLGSAEELQQQLDRVNGRIAQLEKIYQAVVLAQETLTEAADALQRRFAPKIAGAARDLLGRLTGGRYDRLQLGQDLSVNTGAEGENTLHTAQWRSDGTADQLYLALRLAVAGELTPEAPLVLDDALVRFDDSRLARTMEVLQELANNKQVILFTCQSREENHLSGKEF